MRKNRKNLKTLLVIALVVLVAGATYAFTASNTVPGSKAGSGSGAISGYTVSNIHYVINAADPTKMDSVSFNLDAPAGDVQVSLLAGGTVFDCGASGAANLVTCTFGAPQAIVPADSLTVSAVS